MGTEGRVLLEAVARAIEDNDGEPVSAEMVSAHLQQALGLGWLDRSELRRDGFIEGAGIEDCSAPTFTSLAPRGDTKCRAGQTGGLSIPGSSIGSLTIRDVNVSNVNVANFFETRERKIDELEAPPEAKQEVRDRLRRAKEVATGATSNAGGRALSTPSRS